MIELHILHFRLQEGPPSNYAFHHNFPAQIYFVENT